MIRALTGAVLLGLAGPLVIAAGFLPWGHSRTHWGVLTETADSLFDRPPEEPLTRFEAAFWGGEVVGLAYPMVAGVALLLSAFLARSRDAAGAVFVLHLASFTALAVAAGSLIMLPETARSGKPGEPPWRFILAGVVALMLLFVVLQTRVVVRAARRARAGVRPPGFVIDRINLLPAAFLLLLNGGLWAYFSRGTHDWTWQGYPVGAAGCAAALLGIAIRWTVPPKAA